MNAGDEGREETGTRLARLRKIAYWMDEGIRIPGTRFRIGLDPILGLVPGLGDAAGALLAGTVLLQAVRSGIGRFTLLRMAVNIGLDALIGAVPLVGDLFDAGWKANTRNLMLLERHLGSPPEARRADRRFVAVLAGVVLAGLAAAVVGGVLLFVWFLGLAGII